MNSDLMTDGIVELVEEIGWQVNSVHHPGFLTLELVVVPPMSATFAQISAMVTKLYRVPFYGSDIGTCFSTDHDHGISYLRFRQEAPLPDFPDEQPYHESMRAAGFC